MRSAKSLDANRQTFRHGPYDDLVRAYAAKTLFQLSPRAGRGFWQGCPVEVIPHSVQTGELVTPGKT